MRIRTRIALLLAASFLLAGAVVLGVGAVTYQEAVYESPAQQTDRLLDRLGVTREQALAYIRAFPEVVVPTGDEEAGDEGPSGDAEGAEAEGEEPGGDAGAGGDAGTGGDDTAGGEPAGRRAINAAFQDVQQDAQADAIARSRLWSAGALAVMVVAAALAGWLIAGRAVAPLRTITARARAASGADLSGRVALDGPRDEIRELGDTFDAMLDRLERAFVAQRRFSSQVSHEVRTPLAIIASETDLLLRDAEPGSEEQRGLTRVREAADRAERIVGALLVLARSGSGDVQATDLRLDHLAGDVLGDIVNGPDWRRVRVDADLDPAPVRGDRALLERLLANVLANAARHNRPDGWVTVRTCRDGAWSVLEVENSVPDGRPDPAPADGHGVGLTVVDSVVTAHGGDLAWDLDEPGQVTLTVRLPAPA